MNKSLIFIFFILLTVNGFNQTILHFDSAWKIDKGSEQIARLVKIGNRSFMRTNLVVDELLLDNSKSILLQESYLTSRLNLGLGVESNYGKPIGKAVVTGIMVGFPAGVLLGYVAAAALGLDAGFIIGGGVVGAVGMGLLVANEQPSQSQ